ncbi:Mannitol 2-dehydrogenase [Hartmannibacter diazotrophicus]|uniref:Mannitol 2-dehydrogenase n=1 Tax=Hartmannibacter diazotrophicus TaxID=1482074 RepID=A0A2C9DD63_9HYPH|nr:mannitol dehydrogenase family protein [Hartmannibacter diazotrophicus]SON58109.1 Mannitol 2-dehydrogenase [Hartmannibacter diazotrophicus]
MSTRLSASTLGRLPPGIKVPSYDRGSLKAGILHVGIGNFHRAHQAVYLDDLFNMGESLDFALLGAGVRAGDEAMRVALAGQDYLTTVVEQEAGSMEARVTGAMIDFIPPADRTATIDAMCDPAIRIVSLTITEGGYFVDASTGSFDVGHPEIVADGAAPEDPKTVFGMIVLALKRRRAADIPAFTVLSCDNLPHNGSVTRKAVVGLARLSDVDFAGWIDANVAFPNCMVDRITPATSEREKRILAEDFGIDDAWPVFCESFRQWVVEDKFPTGRPALEKVGVEFVPDVAPYELMKIRILNGGHAVIAYPAGLMGIHFVHEAMENDLVTAFLQKIETEEIIPEVPPVPNTDIADYFTLIQRRFANPKIGDTVRRLCLDGSNRQPKFIVPTIADRLVKGLSVTGLALESALWCRYCFGTTDAGETIEPNDPNWPRLQATAQKAKDDPMAWLAMGDVYGDVGKSDAFAKAFATALDSLWTKGTKATVEAYLSDRLV